jgi:hypothetical protein
MFGVFKQAPGLATAAAEVAAIQHFIGGEVLAWKPSTDDFSAIAGKNGGIKGAVNTFYDLMEEIRTSNQQRMNLFTCGFLAGPGFAIGLSGDPSGSGTTISPNLDTRAFDAEYIRRVVPDLMPLPLPQKGRELWLFLADQAVPPGAGYRRTWLSSSASPSSSSLIRSGTSRALS